MSSPESTLESPRKRSHASGDYDRPNRLKDLRELQGLSQKAVADHFGLRQATYARHESGVIALDEFKVRSYADFFGVTPLEIFTDAGLEVVRTEDGEPVRVVRSMETT